MALLYLVTPLYQREAKGDSFGVNPLPTREKPGEIILGLIPSLPERSQERLFWG